MSRAMATWIGLVYAGTVFVSAFLLFQVQPLISKFILPWFGGSPAVWTTSMFFFQVLLFCGYVYAHLSEHYLKPLLQGLVHVALIVAALLLLPITPDPSWKTAAAGSPTWRILCLLAMTVGVPYFVLSSTGPLVQAWFCRTFPGRSPYRLYSLSNIGSLAALISYPFLFEPAFSVGTQAMCWSAGFVLFGLLCGYGATWIWRMGHCGLAPPHATDFSPDVAPAWWQRVLWVSLPAFASLVLLATTNHACQDLPPIPFLWIVPLGLYLLTFIISFDHERWYHRRLFATATLVLTLALAGRREWSWDLGVAAELGLYFASLFAVCMLCHGELVRLRPSPRFLTSYYLLISAGGALGGVFVSLIAPLVFKTYFEWQMALVGGYVLAAVLLLFWRWPALGRPQAPFAVPLGAAIAGLAFVIYSQAGSGSVLLAEMRNFFGEVAVIERDADEPYSHDLAMVHGSIIHGVQFVSHQRRREPTTYYHAHSGLGRALQLYADRPQLRVGAVGLGIGTLAVYARPGQVYRFYEINPDVIDLAQQHFSFLRDCRGTVEIKVGDARLSLEQEAPQAFDVLVLDAFSGDSVPSHLLTQEAFGIYLRHLKPDGTIAVHITNTYLNLAPVVRALAQQHRFSRVRIESDFDGPRQFYQAEWMLLSRNEQLLSALQPFAETNEATQTEQILWTDDHSSLYKLLK